jgi:flavin reductase (DIM6/NTAB) family NADH-FMN oxidoreductase RutF
MLMFSGSNVQWRREERIQRSGLQTTRASHIPAPLVADCRAHLERRLRDTREWGSGLVVVGEIVAASLSEELMQDGHQARYARNPSSVG